MHDYSRRLLLTVLFLPACLVAQKSGTTDREIEIGNTKRAYVLHVPRGYKKSKKKKVPLVLMLHGRGSKGRQAASRYYGWTTLADKEGFIAAFPTAVGSPTSWQAGWGGGATTDSKFLASLIDALIKEFNIDEHRVYMTGHSSGGFMSFSFASTHPEKVAAIGPVAGLAIGIRRKPKMPVSLISFHGMADDVVAYDSKRGKNARWGRGMTSAPESAAIFAKNNGCAKKPERKDLMKGIVHVDTWDGGDKDTRVVFYSIEGWGHGWPKKSRKSVEATPLIWKFFEEHGRSAPGTKKKKKKKSKKQRTHKRQKVGNK
jgi:polyhydroxybutyrate depolymerase